jgi:hypothetical protein
MTGLNPNTRAGDAEREATAQRLNDAHTEGRLDAEEYHDRVDRCYSAKTVGELRALVEDLPRAPSPNGQGGSWPWYRYLTHAPLVPIVLALVALSALTGPHGGWHFPWLALFVLLLFLTRRRSWRRAYRWGGGPSDRL